MFFKENLSRKLDEWMDNLHFYVLLNSNSVISGQWADDNERHLCNGTMFTVEKISPRADWN